MDTPQNKISGSQQAMYRASLSADIGIVTSNSKESVCVQPRQVKGVNYQSSQAQKSKRAWSNHLLINTNIISHVWSKPS